MSATGAAGSVEKPKDSFANPTGLTATARNWPEPFWQRLLLTCFILFLGAIEGWYKRTDFATDAISYLDVSRAIPAHDWKMVFNPLWSVGYPLLLAMVRPLFPSSASGEWLAIHVLNMAVFLGTWLSFIYLLKSLDFFQPGEDPGEALQRRRIIHYAGVCIFIAIQLCIDSVSRVGPDLLVSTFFFLGTATVLRLLRNPGIGRAVVLGLICGAGYWTKGIFFPLAFILIAVTGGAFIVKKKRLGPSPVALAVFLIVAAPYIAGLSRSFGHFTTGESGKLNYMFHVNYLPRWTNWQGGPSGYGTPIHPTHEVMKNPDLFVFSEPYHNTYPPFGNVVYWYQGYRYFWSPKYQATGIARDLRYLAEIVFKQPIFYAVALSGLLLLFSADDRRKWIVTALKLWPFYLAALLGIVLYVQVHLEDRYLGSFLTILCLVPFAVTAEFKTLPSRKTQVQIFVVLALGASLNYAFVDRDIFSHMRHHYTYAENPQWKLGMGLQRIGLKPGDEVAVVGGPNASCTWAYVARVRIVAELGGDPYDQLHPIAGPANQEVGQFWHGSPVLQEKILNLFHDAGAVAAVASDKPADVTTPPGWQHVDGTDSWVYRFR
jgi:hypothetical protein